MLENPSIKMDFYTMSSKTLGWQKHEQNWEFLLCISFHDQYIYFKYWKKEVGWKYHSEKNNNGVYITSGSTPATTLAHDVRPGSISVNKQTTTTMFNACMEQQQQQQQQQ